MERSLQSAERLVDATYLALAQMKQSLTFDDFSEKPETKAKKEEVSGEINENISWKQQLKKFEDEFKSEANEMINKMDRLLNFNKFSSKGSVTNSPSSKARHRIQEINKNMERLKSKKKESKDLESSRQKLLDLINEKQCETTSKTPESYTSANQDLKIGKPFIKIKDVSERTPIKIKSLNCLSSSGKQISKEKSKELKEKILETQQIVDRGVQTARQLTQRVESMAKCEKKPEKTPSTIKTRSSEISLKSLDEPKKIKNKDSVRNEPQIQENKELNKNESTAKKFHSHCSTENLKFTKNKKPHGEQVNKPEKNAIINVNKIERRKFKGPKLQLQHLPSLQLKGSLQIQKVHNLEICPQNPEPIPHKENTGFKVLYHSDVQKEKKLELFENMKNESCIDYGTSNSVVECFNCGKIIRVQRRYLDPKKIDDILLKCNFNVFDPRIDEFVRMLNENGGVPAGFFVEDRKDTDKKDEISGNNKVKIVHENEIESQTDSKPTKCTKEKEKSLPKPGLGIKQLSEKLSKKYKEKARDLEEDHLQLESILQKLYEKVYDSKDFFSCCQLLSFSNKRKDVPQKLKRLTLTQPLVVDLIENNNSSFIKAPENPSSVSDFSEAEKQEQSEIKDNSKIRNKKRPSKRSTDKKMRVLKVKKVGRKQEKEKTKKNLPNKKNDLNFYSKDKSKEPFDGLTASIQVEKCKEEKEEERKNSTFDNYEDFYESDFEGESLEASVNENRSLTDETLQEINEEKSEKLNKFNKTLSVISEVNSELEEKFSSQDGNGKNGSQFLKNPADETESKEGTREKAQKNKLDSEVKLKIVNSSPVYSSSDSSGGKKTNLKKKKKTGGNENYLSSSEKHSAKSSSAEVVVSLKEILSALKDQFERTQSLADKLTVNVETLSGKREGNSGKNSTEREPVLSSRRTNEHFDNFTDGFSRKSERLNNEYDEPFKLPLLSFWSNRSSKEETPEKQEAKNDSDLPLEEETERELIYSAGEIVEVNHGSGSINHKKAESSPSPELIKINDNQKLRETSLMFGKKMISTLSSPLLSNSISEEKLHSDGEIPSRILLDDECSSTHSIGEVISEVISANSIEA